MSKRKTKIDWKCEFSYAKGPYKKLCIMNNTFEVWVSTPNGYDVGFFWLGIDISPQCWTHYKQALADIVAARFNCEVVIKGDK